jgi:DDE superfamily endonuclease
VAIEVKAIACELPATLEVPLSRLFVPDIKAEVIRRGIVATISESTIWRWLDGDAIRPWTFRSWIFPRDPDFEAKAGVVLDLYARQFDGTALGEGDYVISADEKTSIQARCRCHPSLPPARSRPMAVEHEYERAGSLQYLVGWDVHRAKLFGRCEERTGIEPFDRLVAQVMGTEPYASARCVYWVVDNGSSHRGQASIARLEDRYTRGRRKRLRLVHCPVHSSWLNQVEIYNSIIQRKVLTPNDFVDLDEVERRLLAFERRYEAAARPFEWKFTRQDLRKLMARLEGKDLLPAA